MTEISNVSINLSAQKLPENSEVSQNQDEEVTVFENDAKLQLTGNKGSDIFNQIIGDDIGDIHGNTSIRKNGNINGTNFDIKIQLSGDISGSVNGKKVDIKNNSAPVYYTGKFEGKVGDKPVSIKTTPKPLSAYFRNYKGKYGDNDFDISFRDTQIASPYQVIKGKFNNKEFEIKIDKNVFSADDIRTNNNIPKELEEFFPIIYTIAQREKKRSDDLAH